ncbi:MAG: helix-turn-helix domain-containing protein [Alphaproteobacteria bacterium]|nr:helix-turn-helix domain-containing protein [Alphaproteobacteria bacterium]|tara:strand:- start:7686 stop:8660 length:975 start_codon:yes stop_codon:yes gene_type:complete
MHQRWDEPPNHVRGIRLQNASFSDFCERLCAVHSNWALDKPSVPACNAEFRHTKLGSTDFTDVRVGFGLSGQRTVSQIQRTSDTFFGVILMLEGGQRLVQDNHEVDLGPGDISVWDASRPAQFSSTGTVRQISLLVPHTKLKLYASSIEDVCAQRINGRSGLGLLLASHLQALSAVLGTQEEGEVQASTEAATLDLVSAAIRPDKAGDYKSSIHKTMIRRIQNYIVNNLRDPDLSPGMIARSFRISPRYLHKIFEASEYTVSEWILQRRLLACQSSLKDPALNHMTITEIAFNWGFSSAPYFSRVYRQNFGMTPSDARTYQHDT